MPLSIEEIRSARPGKLPKLPARMFGPPSVRGPAMADHPDVRSAVDWFKSFMRPREWEKRRSDAFFLFYQRVLGVDVGDTKGRYFDAKDSFAWHLFLAEAFIDHPWNYEPMFGSRVVPVFAAIGRQLSLLKEVENVDERARRIVGAEKGQPNGGIFELLVAAAYRRDGATVVFRPEERGKAKTWDIDVELNGKRYAVECKRMETGDYGDRERERMRFLWRETCQRLTVQGRSVFCNVDFHVPLDEVPDDYLLKQAIRWLSSSFPTLLWTDGVSEGVIGDLDLDPIRQVFEGGDEVLTSGTRMQQLLTGSYRRYANYIQSALFRFGMTPRYAAGCDQAIMLRWQTSSEKSINGKARDVFKKLAEAHEQLPSDTDSIVHVGLEALESGEVERRRYDKILESIARFDAKGKNLRHVYCHYLMPESPPGESWAFDETVQWRRITGTQPRPLEYPLLVLPSDTEVRSGPYWAT